MSVVLGGGISDEGAMKSSGGGSSSSACRFQLRRVDASELADAERRDRRFRATRVLFETVSVSSARRPR
jgi:hypothetical protein